MHRAHDPHQWPHSSRTVYKTINNNKHKFDNNNDNNNNNNTIKSVLSGRQVDQKLGAV
jgi:hypothetical protein